MADAISHVCAYALRKRDTGAKDASTFSSASGVMMNDDNESSASQDTELTVRVAADQTLLQALRAVGVDVASDCEEGLCGSCEVHVIEGEIDHRDKVLSSSKRAANTRMMSCCSRAKGKKLVLAL
jgi:ferredoxin